MTTELISLRWDGTGMPGLGWTATLSVRRNGKGALWVYQSNADDPPRMVLRGVLDKTPLWYALFCHLVDEDPVWLVGCDDPPTNGLGDCARSEGLKPGEETLLICSWLDLGDERSATAVLRPLDPSVLSRSIRRYRGTRDIDRALRHLDLLRHLLGGMSITEAMSLYETQGDADPLRALVAALVRQECGQRKERAAAAAERRAFRKKLQRDNPAYESLLREARGGLPEATSLADARRRSQQIEAFQNFIEEYARKEGRLPTGRHEVPEYGTFEFG